MPKPTAETLAALLYYDERGSATQFDKLSDEEKAPYNIRAAKIFEMLDKMNLMAAPKVPEEKLRADRLADLDGVTESIKGFVKNLKTTKPDLFPSEELAHWIVEGRKK